MSQDLVTLSPGYWMELPGLRLADVLAGQEEQSLGGQGAVRLGDEVHSSQRSEYPRTYMTSCGYVLVVQG